MGKNVKSKRYRLTVSEEQLRMIAGCVEDMSRFISGQMELSNCTSMLLYDTELHDELRKLQYLVTPELPMGASYKWNGGSCQNEMQRRFIAESYYLYREIKHWDAVNRNVDSVYRSETLRCEDSGMPIVIEEVEEE